MGRSFGGTGAGTCTPGGRACSGLHWAWLPWCWTQAWAREAPLLQVCGSVSKKMGNYLKGTTPSFQSNCVLQESTVSPALADHSPSRPETDMEIGTRCLLLTQALKRFAKLSNNATLLLCYFLEKSSFPLLKNVLLI